MNGGPMKRFSLAIWRWLLQPAHKLPVKKSR